MPTLHTWAASVYEAGATRYNVENTTNANGSIQPQNREIRRLESLGRRFTRYPTKKTQCVGPEASEGTVEPIDEVRANRMADELIGKSVGQWELVQYLGCGKSALVFKGRRNGLEGAVKVFDPELIQRFGKETQLQRIKRELLIRDNGHEHLVRIIDGGECSVTAHLFVVMECIEAPTLEKVIKVVPRDAIRRIIGQVALAAQHLESLELCHRDIKPSNIVISPDYQKATLLDLGVLRPIGSSDLTDEQARNFVGTLRYSSPEFLMRTELDTVEGWRAVTFYQLGAVLHDLIMRRPLFDEFTHPFGRLVEAVKEVTPRLEADDVPPDLIHLARTCLIKDPNVRIQLVRWESFSLVQRPSQPVQAAKERVRQRYAAVQSDTLGYTPPEAEREARRRERLHRQILDKIEAIIRLACSESDVFPPMELRALAGTTPETSHIVVTFLPSSSHELRSSLYLLLRISLMDVATEAISLSYWSGVAGERIDSRQLPKDDLHPLFDGAYEDSIVKEKIEEFLFLSLDAAQCCRSHYLSPNGSDWLSQTRAGFAHIG